MDQNDSTSLPLDLTDKNNSLFVRTSTSRDMALTVGPFEENGRTYRMISSPTVCGLALAVHCVHSLFLNETWMVLAVFLTFVLLICALYLKRRKSPVEILVLAGFVMIQAHTVGIILSIHPHGVGLRASLLTLATLAGLSVYANRTKQIFSSVNSLILVCFSVLILGGFSQTFSRSTKLDLTVSAGGALVFGILGIVDTQKSLQASSLEQYVISTINLYMDVINLLVYILRILHLTV